MIITETNGVGGCDDGELCYLRLRKKVCEVGGRFERVDIYSINDLRWWKESCEQGHTRLGLAPEF